MKPFYVVLLMGAAALGGGLVVRYSDHPVEITLAHSVPPDVVAPPIPPNAHVGPSTSVPVRSAPRPIVSEPPAQPEKPEKAGKTDKPSAFSVPAVPAKPEPRYIGRTRIPPEPPAVIPLEFSSVAPRTPLTVMQVPLRAASPESPAAKPAPAPPAAEVVPPPAPAPPEPNHATLRAGMLITVRINQALSSNLNSQGDVFSGFLDKPLIADGFVIAERGARVRGEVVESKSDRTAPELAIRLREIQASDGQRVHIVSEPWRKSSASATTPGSVYDVALTRGGAAVIRPATSITFRLDQAVEITEKANQQ